MGVPWKLFPRVDKTHDGRGTATFGSLTKGSTARRERRPTLRLLGLDLFTAASSLDVSSEAFLAFGFQTQTTRRGVCCHFRKFNKLCYVYRLIRAWLWENRFQNTLVGERHDQSSRKSDSLAKTVTPSPCLTNFGSLPMREILR